MTAPRDVRMYLEDIIHAIENIERYTKGIDAASLKEDSKTQDAVVRNLEVIGEAVKRIPESIRTAYPHIEWRPAAAMRDFLIHEYPEVDSDAVWQTLVQDLPPFKKGISECLTGLKDS